MSKVRNTGLCFFCVSVVDLGWDEQSWTNCFAPIIVDANSKAKTVFFFAVLFSDVISRKRKC